MKKVSKKHLLAITSVFFFFLLSLNAVFHSFLKPLPKDTSILGNLYPISDNNMKLLIDTTWQDPSGARKSDQEIFDTVLEMIHNARDFILIDMFLFGSSEKAYRHLTRELTDALIQKKQSTPDINIILITDPYNTMYMPEDSLPEFRALEQEGINVVLTNIHKLRDPNVLYSPFWRLFLQWWGTPQRGWIPNIFTDSPKKLSLRSFFTMLNFKANHRKIVLADKDGKIAALITSANPHDPSSAHSNIGLYFESESWKDIYRGEKALIALSNEPFSELDEQKYSRETPLGNTGSEIQMRYLTESKIRTAVLDEINNTQKGDHIRLAMFYLSDRKIIKALIRSAKRGVDIQIILDPNKDAFGRKKNGIPNRQTASTLVKRSGGRIRIRWYATHGEQFHTKMLLILRDAENSSLILGSANFTRRNLSDYNLEADVKITGPKTANIFQEADAYFSLLWNNTPEKIFTQDYSAYAENNVIKNIIAFLQEVSGLGAF